MLARPELLIIGGIAVVVVVVLLAATGRLGSTSKPEGSESKTIVVDDAADAWLGRVATGLNGLSAHRVEWSSADTLLLYWTRRPVWTFAVAALFFPFGLLALLYTKTYVGRFVIVGGSPSSRVAIDGEFSALAVDLVNRAIPD